MCFPHWYTKSVERRKKYFCDAVKCALWRGLFFLCVCVCVNCPAFVIYEGKMLRGYFVGSITGARLENLFSFWARREVPLHLVVSLPWAVFMFDAYFFSCYSPFLLFLLLAVSSFSRYLLFFFFMVDGWTWDCSLLFFLEKKRKIIFWEKKKKQKLPKCEDVKIVNEKVMTRVFTFFLLVSPFCFLFQRGEDEGDNA